MLRLLATLTLLVAAAPASAQNAARPQAPPSSAIDPRVSASNDSKIAALVRNIFGQIPPLRDVEVVASVGVVTLRGSVPAAGGTDRAESIASRV
ncbi:MAG: hypothetical protein ABI810_06050 [Sphingomonas bacterium]